MLDPKLLRADIAKVAAALATRGMTLDVAQFAALEQERRTLQVMMQEAQHSHKLNSKQFARRDLTPEQRQQELVKLQEASKVVQDLEQRFNVANQALQDWLALLPNIPHESVVVGADESANVIARIVGEPPDFNFTPLDHLSLGAKLAAIDVQAAAKLTGARFVVLTGQVAHLHRALIQFMLDMHTRQHGYQEVYAPAIVNAESLFATTQLPKFGDELFALADSDRAWYLSPTAEVQLSNLLRDTIIPAEQLPIKYVCHSPCFRSEAGSYGKDVYGMIRNHQFEKVELVQITHPQHSYQALEELTQHAEAILQALELPYRVVALATGDLGFAAAKTYDLEVWLPGQDCYREISSCSNTESFQARRLQARMRENGNIALVHTLNGSGLAVGRTLVAVLENYQDEYHNIKVPRVLQPYMHGLEYINVSNN